MASSLGRFGGPALYHDRSALSVNHPTRGGATLPVWLYRVSIAEPTFSEHLQS